MEIVIVPSAQAVAESVQHILDGMGLGDLTHPDVAVGRAAARDGMALTDCPYRPGDAAGKYWRRGWLDATAMATLP